jgi:predicted phosphodiesterase
LKKNENESIKEYKIRICEQKEVLMLTWDDIAKYINIETGDSFSESYYRKWWHSFKEGYEYRQIELENLRMTTEDFRRIEFEKEKQKFYDQRVSYNKSIRKDSRYEDMLDIIKDTIIQNKPVKLEYNSFPVNTNSDNDLLVHLNDLHYGADINNAWNIYNSDICKKYLEEYLEEILKIKQLHNSQNCFVVANGDLISGNIHYEIAVENKENIIQQVTGVSELISEFIYELSKHFNRVTFGVVAGNHSRLNRKDESLYTERLDDIIIWYLKADLKNIVNVSFVKNIDPTMNTINIRGKKYLNVHGDYDNGQTTLTAINFNSGNDIYAVCCGHKHHNKTEHVNNIKVFMAGSMIGIDSYCVKHRLFTIPQQMVCVCTEKGSNITYDINFTQ